MTTILSSWMLKCQSENGKLLPKDNSPWGIQAAVLNLPKSCFPELPASEKDGKIKTLNSMGFMTAKIDHITEDFINFAAKAKKPVLDIGAAYGVATVAALKKGAKVIANDIEEKHLLLLTKNSSLTTDDKLRLYLNNHSLPHGLELPDDSLSAILMCRVMHFFTPEDIVEMFKKAKKWLIPNGRFYIVTMTPYHYSLHGFSKTYNERMKKGDEWPGIILTMTSDYLPENAGKIPDYLHVLDERLLTRIAIEQGFLIKKMELFGHNLSATDNQLGYIGVVLINNSEV